VRRLFTSGSAVQVTLVRLAAVGLALAAWSAVPQSAVAMSPVDGSRVLLGFARTYGSGSIHRGVDLAADVGASVRAPVSGLVSFVGAVPADGGGTAIAVTLEAPDGTKVTVMPLARALAKRGAMVEAGSDLGLLADAGDASSAETHVHLSLRRGSVYLDPTPLLAAPPVPYQEPAPTPATQSAGAGAGAGAAGSAVVGAAGAVSASRMNAPHAASPGLASGVTLAPRPTVAPTPPPMSVQAQAPAQGVQPGVVLGPGVAAGTRAGSGAAAAATAAPRGLDVAELLDRVQRAVTLYAHRHVRALALGVGALLAGIAALAPLGSRTGSRGAVGAVRPEGEAVAAAAGR
jgi:hypothetical protein